MFFQFRMVTNGKTYLSMLPCSSTTCSTIFMYNGNTFGWIKIKRAKVPTNGIFDSCQFGCLRIENHNCLGSYFSTNTSSTIAMPNENTNM